MPPHRRQPVLLDEGALQNALSKKSTLRGDDGGIAVDGSSYDDPAAVVPSTAVKRNSYLLEPQTSTRKRQLGSGMILLDENRLEQALKAKAERRKVAENSLERRRQTRSSLDRLIDDSDMELPIAKSNPPKKSLSKRRMIPALQQAKPVRAARADVDLESVSMSTNGQRDASDRPSDQMIVKKKKLVRRVKKKRPQTIMTNSGAGSSSSVVSVVSASPSIQSSRPPAPPPPAAAPPAATATAPPPLPSSSAIHVNEPPRPTRTVKKQQSDRRPRPAASKAVPPVKIKSAPPASSNIPQEKPLQHGRGKPPSKRSNAAAAIAKRNADRSVSALEDPSEIINISDHSRAAEPTSSFRSQPSSFRKQQPQSGTSRSKAKTTFNLQNLPSGSDHSQTAHSQPASYRKQQPPSWSVRNETKTGFTPNPYITKETMTHYTDNLGGVETVATTTKIFFDKAKYDPELKEFFHSIRWEHVRNEFIILANLEVPEKYDENIMGVLEHHCGLLENGANIDKLITIWESAIESSWLDHHMDDARQLIVGPSRVIFNLKALERHYAMHQKGVRAAAKASRASERNNKKSSNSGIFGRFRRGN